MPYWQKRDKKIAYWYKRFVYMRSYSNFVRKLHILSFYNSVRRYQSFRVEFAKDKDKRLDCSMLRMCLMLSVLTQKSHHLTAFLYVFYPLFYQTLSKMLVVPFTNVSYVP